MDKKLFEDLKRSLADMEAHAAGKKVRGVRAVVREVASPKPMSEPKFVALRKRPKYY